jgi:16S rRNA (guanine966-N2)-methyltransferase
MRIVGGRFRGRALAAPATRDIRPTSDRLRESLFNILAHAHGDKTDGARVLDLFAGTGALGFEALSRGAASCVFVDDSADSRGLIRTTIEAFGLTGVTKLLKRDATRLGEAAPVGIFDLVFCDPPYGKGLAEAALVALRDGRWLAPDALVIVEEAAASRFVAPTGFTELDRRAQGETKLVFLEQARG